jgi:nucleotide-binding universal stress UspA family protein
MVSWSQGRGRHDQSRTSQRNAPVGPSPLSTIRNVGHHRGVESKVIVPLSDEALSLRALPAARELVRFTDVDVLLLSVVRTEEEARRRRGRLRSIAHSFERGRVEVHAVVDPDGDPSVAVATSAADDDLVVMASHADVFRGDHFVGSFTEALVARHAGPVLVVGPACDVDSAFAVDRVVVAVDVNRAESDLAIEAARWARLLDVPLWLVATPGEREDSERSARMALQREAHTLRSGDLDVEWRLFEAETLVEPMLEMIEAGALPVVTTEPHVGLDRIAHRSVTTEICARSSRPVLIKGSHDV